MSQNFDSKGKSWQSDDAAASLSPADDETEISKSQMKRDALAVRSLARQLVELKQTQLARVPLDDSVLEAINDARKMRSHGARKRQLMFVAKKLRQSETADIERALESFQSDARKVTAHHHRSEYWRDRLINEGDSALTELLEQRSDVQSQAVRQWIRKAQREHSAGKPPAAARSLFRLLRELDERSPLPVDKAS